MPNTVLVTGATSGIGREAAIELARAGLRVIVHGRDERRLADALETVRMAGDAEGVLADLSAQRQVRDLAEQVSERFGDLDVLVNNAGVYEPDRADTPDGIETTMAVDLLAPFMLQNLLFPTLRRNAPSRIVNTASIAHLSGSVETIYHRLSGRDGYDAHDAYASAKLGLVMVTFEMAERVADTGVTVNCLHPGVISTKLLHEGSPYSGGRSVKEGGSATAFLAASEKVASVTGRFFDEEQQEVAAGEAYRPGLRKALWEECVRLTGVDLTVRR